MKFAFMKKKNCAWLPLVHCVAPTLFLVALTTLFHKEIYEKVQETFGDKDKSATKVAKKVKSKIKAKDAFSDIKVS